MWVYEGPRFELRLVCMRSRRVRPLHGRLPSLAASRRPQLLSKFLALSASVLLRPPALTALASGLLSLTGTIPSRTFQDIPFLTWRRFNPSQSTQEYLRTDASSGPSSSEVKPSPFLRITVTFHCYHRDSLLVHVSCAVPSPGHPSVHQHEGTHRSTSMDLA